MEINRVDQVSEQKVAQLVALNPDLDKQLLLNCGYVVDIEEEVAGCFALDPVNPGEYWLRQLQVTPEAAGSIVVLLETALTMAKEKGANALYVYSHQSAVDTLLGALQFRQTVEAPAQMDNELLTGKWWTYKVS